MLVAAAIIKKEGRILIARRPAGKQLAGLWEFPGGKIEEGESAAQALKRELREELGIEAIVGRVLARVSHDYPFGRVEIIALVVESFSGELKPTEHDELAWALPSELDTYALTPADWPVVRLLAREGS